MGDPEVGLVTQSRFSFSDANLDLNVRNRSELFHSGKATVIREVDCRV
jgi:hypothetical protein